MPTVDDYAKLAPFTLEELVDAANSVLRDRPRAGVSVRTVRYYVAEGILPPPVGPNKLARYTLEHLDRLVQARRMLDEGASLVEISNALGPPQKNFFSEPAKERSKRRRVIPLIPGVQLLVHGDVDVEARTIEIVEAVLKIRKLP